MSTQQRWLVDDAGQFSREFNHKAFQFSHRLCESPLFEVEQIARLAEQLPGKDIYNSDSRKAVDEKFSRTRKTQIGPADAIRRIDESDSWVVLKRIEQVPPYDRLIDELKQEVIDLSGVLRHERILKCEGFIFCTSPATVTPYHIDHQWSFLAQIRGHKTYKIYDKHQPGILTDAEMEAYFCGNANGAQYDASKESAAAVFELDPGQAVHQPIYAPHSALVGDRPSISFSLAIVTRRWEAEGNVHRVNAALRRRGMHPKPVGASKWSDQLKDLGYRVKSRTARVFGR